MPRRWFKRDPEPGREDPSRLFFTIGPNVTRIGGELRVGETAKLTLEVLVTGYDPETGTHRCYWADDWEPGDGLSEAMQDAALGGVD